MTLLPPPVYAIESVRPGELKAHMTVETYAGGFAVTRCDSKPRRFIGFVTRPREAGPVVIRCVRCDEPSQCSKCGRVFRDAETHQVVPEVCCIPTCYDAHIREGA